MEAKHLRVSEDTHKLVKVEAANAGKTIDTFIQLLVKMYQRSKS